ncbi:hypothetical protein H2199_008600 [Coniosporium tulheliwenetii]|uniref:Uncharacterized protein n=1 Tax=Coniosporium tulheliwenetii TaxID=3383036 RepID=A0ACC2YIU2_9PEZI|nr:hypothetical protein H2199_008600 [Cladosporium sp. JES 115]
MSDLKVLVVGASIAGPMAAYWLAEAGAEATIIERYPALRSGGQNIDIRTCGVTVVRKIPGLEAALKASLAPLEDNKAMKIVDDQDRPYITIKGTGDAEQQSLVSEYEIFRDDLSRILHDFTKGNERIRYVFGEQVASLRQEKDRVFVEFANGKLPPSNSDLVVAADGATSRTRALGMECKVRDHIEPLNAWAGYCTVPRNLLRGGKMALFSTSTPGRATMIAPDHHLGRNRIVLMSSYPRSAVTAEVMRPFREAVKAGDGATKQFLAQHFRGHPRYEEIMPAVRASDNLYASEAVQVKAPSLHKGRFVLIGDAGYAAGPVGTGTSLAITGAYLLAGEISNHPGDLAAGLRSYESRMQPIIQDMQQIPPGFPGIMTPQAPWALSLRNAVIQVIAALITASEFVPIAKLFSWVAATFSSSFGTDKYNIPEYNWKS